MAGLVIPIVGHTWLPPGMPDAGVLVGQSHGRDIGVAAVGQPRQPGFAGFFLALGGAKGRACAMDQEGPQIGITAFTDAQEAGLAAGRGLLRDQAQPGRQLPAMGEGLDVADGGEQGGGNERADAGNLGQPA